MSKLRQGFRYFFRRSQHDADVRREVSFHLQSEIDQRIGRGMTPEEARRTALRDFGGIDRTTEEIMDVRGMTFWDQLVQDVRFGVRTLRRSPGYTLAAMLILALGIGANTAIFSVISGVLLKPLPFRDGQQLVLIQQAAPASNRTGVGLSIPEVFDYRKRLETVRDLVEYHGMSFTLLNQGEPDRVDTGVVSANFFEMLGVKPELGRTFADGDDDLGSEAVLILSHEYWQSKFGGDRNVVGKVLQMNNRPHMVVGVLPAYPQYPRQNDVYMPTSACPFRSNAEQRLPAGGFRSFGGLRAIGRLAPGVSEAKASAEIATIAASFEKDHADDYQRLKGFTGQARSLQDQLTTDARPMLLALAGTTMLVLLIACANVANLALARTMRRNRELSVRTALGASRGRLFRQLVTESLVLALAGGAIGLGLAWLSLGLLVDFVGRFTARTGQISIDAGVLWFAVATAVVTGLVFGAAPALAIRRSLAQSVRDGGAQTGEGGKRHRLRGALVVAQVAVSFVLVVGAALLLTSFYRLSNVPLGYEARQVMTANIFGNFSRFSTNEDTIRIQSDILNRLRAAPGVRSAAITSAVPLSALQGGVVNIQLESVSTSDTKSLQVAPSAASDGYFETLGTPILTGRSLRSSDDAKVPLVAVINVSMSRLWESTTPLGRRFKIAGTPPPGQPPFEWITVVGIVGDFHVNNLDQEVEPQFYTPFQQGNFSGGQLLVRTDGRTADLVPVIKSAVHATDAEIPVEDIQTLEALHGNRIASPGLTAALLSIFAGVALLVTLAGIAGVIGTSVSQRTREFGVRMALGASRASVLMLVLRQGTLLVIIGIVLGLGGAAMFNRLIARYLFATTPTDAVAYVTVSVVFLIAALAATLAPARRATTIDPLKALRTE